MSGTEEMINKTNLGKGKTLHGEDSIHNPLGVRDQGGPPANEVNSVGDEHETKSPHGAHFEFCEKDGNHFEAADATGHGGRGNFLTHGK